MKEDVKNSVMVGANTEIWMDGVKLDNITAFKLEIPARGIAKITLEMVGQVSVIGNFCDVNLQKANLAPVNNEYFDDGGR